jgi:hypothetical protein
VLGGAVAPAIQLKVTELVYPLRALAVPLKVVVCPRKAVCGEFEIASSKSGIITRLNCQIPRPYVDARNNCCPPELNTASAVTATLGRNPGWSVLEVGPSSVQLAADVELPNTPTSVAT